MNDTDRLARIAPLSGLAFALLFGLGSGLWALEQPARDASDAEVLAFFSDTSTAILAGGTLSIVSVPLLVWFGSFLRRWLEPIGDSTGDLRNLVFAGAVLTGAVGLAAETINMAGALSAEDGQLTPGTAQVLFDLTYAFGAHAAGITFAMMVLPVGVLTLRGGGLPRHAAWGLIVLGVALITPALLFRPAFLVLYAATVVSLGALGVYLYRQRPQVS